MIFLIRHAETKWNAEKRKQGLDDSPLTERGQAQAKAYAKAMANQIKEHNLNPNNIHLHISPLGRTQTTAKPIIQTLNLPAENIHTEPRLIEYDYGNWSGLTNHQIEQQYPGELEKREQDKWNYQVPNGESYREVETKITGWLNNLPKDQITIAVTHSVVSRVLRGKYLELSNQEAGQLEHKQDFIFLLHETDIKTINTNKSS